MSYFNKPYAFAIRARDTTRKIGLEGVKKKDIPVIDKGRTWPRQMAPMSTNLHVDMHRTARDNQAPRRVLTAVLMGDPPVGRSAHDRMEGRSR